MGSRAIRPPVAGVNLGNVIYLRTVRDLCTEHGVLLIVDEVATGFGRTGKMFACEHEGVTPDLMTVAKGITGGYLPLAATFTTERIYQSFLGTHEEFKTFFHGHTYTGNPLACAAALASLDVFETEGTLDHVADLRVSLAEMLKPIALMPRVKEIRRRGLMVGIELSGFNVEQRSGHQVTLAARKRETEDVWKSIDAMVVPTAPNAPTVADVMADPLGPNARLGTWTNFVNLLDLAALAVPGPFRPDGLPAGITLIGPRASDAALASLEGLDACNGWTFWHFDDGQTLRPIDELRAVIRNDLATVE